MSCLKENWREQLFKLLPNLETINKVDRSGKQEDEISEKSADEKDGNFI